MLGTCDKFVEIWWGRLAQKKRGPHIFAPRTRGSSLAEIGTFAWLSKNMATPEIFFKSKEPFVFVSFWG